MLRAAAGGFLAGTFTTLLVCLGVAVMDIDMDEDVWAER